MGVISSKKGDMGIKQLAAILGILMISLLVVVNFVLLEPLIMRTPAYISRTSTGTFDSILSAPEQVLVTYGSPEAFTRTLEGSLIPGAGQNRDTIKFMTFKDTRVCTSTLTLCEIGSMIGWQWMKAIWMRVIERPVYAIVGIFTNAAAGNWGRSLECFGNIVGWGPGCDTTEKQDEILREIDSRIALIERQLTCYYFTEDEFATLEVIHCSPMGSLEQYTEAFSTFCGKTDRDPFWGPVNAVASGGISIPALIGHGSAGGKLKGCFWNRPPRVVYYKENDYSGFNTRAKVVASISKTHIESYVNHEIK